MSHDEQESAMELADTFAALDEWLSKGGFLPAAWVPPLLSNTQSFVSDERATYRLKLAFERTLLDDEELDKRFSTDEQARRERDRLATLLAQEVVREVDRERAQLEQMMQSAASAQFLEGLRKALAEEPAAHPPGFTAAGWARLNDQGKGDRS